MTRTPPAEPAPTEPASARLLPEKIVVCPACRGPSLYSLSNPHRPFCCGRCKNADFGAWASEDFRVAAREPAEDAPQGD